VAALPIIQRNNPNAKLVGMDLRQGMKTIGYHLLHSVGNANAPGQREYAMNLLRLLLLSLVLVAAGCDWLRHPQPQPVAEAGPGQTIYITVRGDTLIRVANKFNTGVQTIIDLNHLTDTTLVADMRLIVPQVEQLVPKTEPAPVVAVAPAPVVPDETWYKPRSSWAVESLDESNMVPMAPIYRITVHHSGTPSDADADPVELLRKIEHNHKHDKSPPWAAIGYHFVITADGTVYEARPLKWQGAHATGDNNIGNIGICLLGDFDHHQVPAKQKAALIDALDRLRAQYHIDQGNVFGHRELKLTDCPGKYLMAVVVKYRGGRPDSSVGESDKKDD
jgi:LysM repeat protein